MPNEENLKCPSCGTGVDNDDIECPNCGEILLDFAVSDEEENIEEEPETENDVEEPSPQKVMESVNDQMGLGSLGDMIEKKILNTLRDREEKLRESMKRSVREKERLWRERAEKKMDDLRDKHEQERTMLMQQLDALREEKESLRQKFESEKEELREKIDSYTQEIESLKEKHVGEREELRSQLVNEKEELRGKLESEKKELEARIDQMRTEIKEIERKAEARRDEIRKMHDEEKENLRRNLEQEKTEALQRVIDEKKELQETLQREKEEAINRLMTEIQREKDEKKDLQDHYQGEKEALKKRYEEELEALRERIDLERKRSMTQESDVSPEIMESIGVNIEDKISSVVFPFPAIVGQERMKRSLLLNAINPEIKGVLLWGPRGSGKTTALIGLAEVLSDIEEVELEKVKIWEDPSRYISGAVSTTNANASYLVDTVLRNGILSTRIESDLTHGEKPLIVVDRLSSMDQTLLSYLDSLTLHVRVENPDDVDKRIEIIRRYKLFKQDPEAFHSSYRDEIESLRDRIIQTRQLLPSITVSPKQRSTISNVCIHNNLPSGTDIILEEIARTVTAYDGRDEVMDEDIQEAIDLAMIHRVEDSLK